MNDRPRVVLGAGFSKAVSPEMPTVGELTDELLSELGDVDRAELATFDDNLEQWLSFLAVDQPYLNSIENLRNRAQFLRVSDALTGCIERAEARTVATPAQGWLLRLVWTWCEDQAFVYTFNYDTLVERVIRQIGRVGTWADVYAASLSTRIAPGEAPMVSVSPPNGNILSLFKLHGSTSWRFGGLDAPPSERITLAVDGLAWGNPALGYTPPPRFDPLYDDVVPMLVPPTLAKGPYFANVSLRSQWRHAALSLMGSNQLTILGYSLPDGDLVARQWLATSFRGGTLNVVDAAPERPMQVRNRIPGALPGLDVVNDQAIARFVDQTCGDLVRWEVSTDPITSQTVALFEVNGVDRTAQILGDADLSDAYQTRQRLEAIIEGVAPDAVVRGINLLGPTGRQLEVARMTVLPRGSRIPLG